MWPFNGKEPVKKWLGWGRFKQCCNCNRLQTPFYFDFKESVCPDCGSYSIIEVTARWEESINKSGFMCERILHRHEIKYNPRHTGVESSVNIPHKD